MSEPTSVSSKDVTLLARLRRYLPYLGIYAADVREAIAEIEMARNAEETADRNRSSALAEIERLRAALGKIASGQLNEVAKLHRVDCIQIAKEALSGDPSVHETSPHLSAAELLIPATRYYIGRMTIHTTVHAQALARGWHSVPQNVRNVIRTDLEDAFRRDDAMRGDPVCSSSYYPLGGDVDREAWEEVRKAWLSEPSAVETKACPHGMPLAENICGPCSKGEPNRPAGCTYPTCGCSGKEGCRLAQNGSVNEVNNNGK